MAPLPITRRAGILKGESVKHTPKPWRIVDSKWYPTVRIIGPNDEGLASFGNQQRWLDRHTVYANARLMTAAPELLEACIAVRAFDNNGPSWHQAMRKIDLAIAKATGEDAT